MNNVKTMLKKHFGQIIFNDVNFKINEKALWIIIK